MTAPILPIGHPETLERAADVLRDGGLVIIPTDTVYGVAAAPHAHEALERLHEARQAEPWPALPLLLDDADALYEVARPATSALRLARYFWPGAVTLLLPSAPDFPIPLDNPRVALRVPNCASLRPLLRAMEGYLIVGRASRSGYPSAITAREAEEQLGEDVTLILDGGRSPLGLPSTVVDCIQVPARIVQRGAVPDEKILAVLDSSSREE